MEGGHCRLPAPLGFPTICSPPPLHQGHGSLPAEALPSCPKGGGGGFQGPIESGREGAERGRWLGKGPLLDFAPEGHCAKASQPFTWPNRKFTPKKTPCGNFKECPAERAFAQPISDLGHQLCGQLPYCTAAPLPAGDAVRCRSGTFQSGQRDARHSPQGGAGGGGRWVGSRALV